MAALTIASLPASPSNRDMASAQSAAATDTTTTAIVGDDGLEAWLARALLDERLSLRAALAKSHQESREAMDAELAQRHKDLTAGLREQIQAALDAQRLQLPNMIEANGSTHRSAENDARPLRGHSGHTHVFSVDTRASADEVSRPYGDNSWQAPQPQDSPQRQPGQPQEHSISVIGAPIKEKFPEDEEDTTAARAAMAPAGSGDCGAVVIRQRDCEADKMDKTRSTGSSKAKIDVENRVSTLLFHNRPSASKEQASWADFIEGARFEMTIGILILLNAAQMAIEVQFEGLHLGYQLDYRAYKDSPNPWPGAKGVLQAVSIAFGVIFTCEVALKIAVLRREFFKTYWNLFDLTLVVFFLVEAVGSADDTAKQTTQFRIARLVRLLRLVRVLRQIRSFDALFLMTTAISSSAIVLAWSCVLLLMMQVLVAFVINQILELFYFVNLEEHPLEERQVVFEYFGTFSRALLSTFEMTLANWPPVCRVLVEYVNEWFMVFCLLHKLTIGFAVIGIINGVFIQETFRVAAQDDFIMMHQKEFATRTHMTKMKKLFAAGDASGDGELDKTEFLLLMKNPEVKTWLSSMGLDAADGDALFEFMDQDKDHVVNIDELVEGVSKLKGVARSLDLLVCIHKQEQICQLLLELNPEAARNHRARQAAGPVFTSTWAPDLRHEDEDFEQRISAAAAASAVAAATGGEARCSWTGSLRSSPLRGSQPRGFGVKPNKGAVLT